MIVPVNVRVLGDQGFVEVGGAVVAKIDDPIAAVKVQRVVDAHDILVAMVRDLLTYAEAGRDAYLRNAPQVAPPTDTMIAARRLVARWGSS